MNEIISWTLISALSLASVSPALADDAAADAQKAHTAREMVEVGGVASGLALYRFSDHQKDRLQSKSLENEAAALKLKSDEASLLASARKVYLDKETKRLEGEIAVHRAEVHSLSSRVELGMSSAEELEAAKERLSASERQLLSLPDKVDPGKLDVVGTYVRRQNGWGLSKSSQKQIESYPLLYKRMNRATLAADSRSFKAARASSLFETIGKKLGLLVSIASGGVLAYEIYSANSTEAPPAALTANVRKPAAAASAADSPAPSPNGAAGSANAF